MAFEELYNEKGAADAWQTIVELSAPTSPVNIIEKEDCVIIYAYVNISGDIKDNTLMGTDITYGEAALMGLEGVWSGEYNGKEIISWAIESTDAPSINVRIYNGAGITRVDGWESFENPGTIELYAANRHGNSWYNYREFYLNAGHEFGHVLGIEDMYNDDDFAKFRTVSIMNNQILAKKAQQIDYAMMFKAQKSRQFQSWSKNIDFLKQLGLIR